MGEKRQHVLFYKKIKQGKNRCFVGEKEKNMVGKKII
jgi:hypothetical protein